MNLYSKLSNTQRIRVLDGTMTSLFDRVAQSSPLLFIAFPQLGDFDSLEYAWWLNRYWQRITNSSLTVLAVGIGDRSSGQEFCQFTGFPESQLFIDPEGNLHQELGLYPGLQFRLPFFSMGQNAWLNLMLMCAGLGSPGTLSEVFRGYKGDRTAPQLIAAEEVVQAPPLPPIQGKFFDRAGGNGFQRPFELATLRLRNMAEVLGKWKTYVPASDYLTQRGGTFLFNDSQELIYEHRDPGILGFSETMNHPLDFLWDRIGLDSTEETGSNSHNLAEMKTSR